MAKFVAVPDSVLRDPHLSFPAKLLFGVLRYRQYDKSCCWPSIEGLAKQLGGISRGTVCRAIGQLEKAGYITIKRRHRQSNIYTVRNIRDRSFLRIQLDLIGLPGISAIDKLLIASLEYKSYNDDGHAYPHQERLARELGCSRSTIFRALERLEAERRIQVVHRGGGRKRGNYYVVADAFYRLVLGRGPEKTVSKRGAKDKYSEEFKRTIQQRDFSQRVLSSKDKMEPSRVKALLTAHPIGMLPQMADRLIYKHKIPLPTIQNSIKNALARQYWLSVRDPFAAKQFNLAGFVINCCRNIRREGKAEVKLSLRAKALERRKDYVSNEHMMSKAKLLARLDEQKRLLGVA